MFGEFLESLAIYICGQVYGGKKSDRPSIDLEFASELCENGKIDWVKLVQFNSAHLEQDKHVRERRSRYSVKKR